MEFSVAWHIVGVVIGSAAALYHAIKDKFISVNMVSYIAAGYALGPLMLALEYMQFRGYQDFVLYSWGTAKADEPAPADESFPKV